MTLSGGDTYTARLVAIACGTGGELLARLGMRRVIVQQDQSVAFGFTIAAQDGQPVSVRGGHLLPRRIRGTALPI